MYLCARVGKPSDTIKIHIAIQHMHAVGGCGANTNVSSHIRVAWHRDTKYVHDTSKKQARYSLIQVALHVSCIYPARQS